MKKIIPLFLFLILSFLITWIFWLPGPRVANDYYLGSMEVAKENTFFWIWRETAVADGLGEYTAPTAWSQPLHLVFGILSWLNLPMVWQTKMLLLTFFIVGFLSIHRLLSFLQVSGFAKYVGILLYLFNTYSILLIDGGQLSIALTYAVIPLAFFQYLRVLKPIANKNYLYLISSVLLVSFLDLRYTFVIVLLILIHFFCNLFLSPSYRIQSFMGLLKIFFILGFFLFLAHSYWILPVLFSNSISLPQTYERISQLDFLSLASLNHAIFLQQPHWYENIFGKLSYINIIFSPIPFIIFLAPMLVRKSSSVAFWSVVALLGIFLSKGSNEPLGEIYVWLFSNIPGFSLFRDSMKFYIFVTLSYSVLVSIVLEKISGIKPKGKYVAKLAKFSPVIVFVYIILLMSPVYLTKMTGMFSFPRFQNEYLRLANYLQQDLSFSRIFWIPTQAPLGYSDLNHPALKAPIEVDRRPFAVGVRGTYEQFNFLREAQYMGQIFDVAGIGYIAYPLLDSIRDDMHPDNIRYFYDFNNQIANLPWLSEVESSIPLYKVKEFQDRFFTTPNIWWILGSDSIYNEATKSSGLKLSKNALIFAEETGGLGEKIEELANAKIVLNNKTLVDLSASFIKLEDLFFPAKYLELAPNFSGWWKREAVDLVWWRNFIQTKYGIDNQDFDLGGGWAVGEGNKKYQALDIKYEKGDLLLARVMESQRGGSLKFFDGSDQLIGGIITKLEGNANVRWFEVGELQNDGDKLTIESYGDINVVNAITLINKNEWEYIKKKANNLKGRIVDFDEKNVLYESAEITYKKINPTKYKVNVAGLTSPSMLVFSQNYNRLWKMNSQSSVPIYSLLNGFTIEKDGTYIVEFDSQKYVYIGFFISGFALLLLTILLIKYRGK